MTAPWMEYLPLGDLEAAVVDILINETPEMDVPGKPTISTNMVGYNPGDRWIEVSQQGGYLRMYKVHKIRIDVEVLAERRSVAKDIAEICLASLIRQMGVYEGFGVKILSIVVEQGVTRIPDKYQEQERYLFSLRIICIPFGDPLGFPPS